MDRVKAPHAGLWSAEGDEEMTNVARIGAYAGWISVIGIFLHNIGLTAIVGQRVSGTTDVAAIQEYYKHTIIAPASIAPFVVMIAVLVFTLALREILGALPGARFLANLGLLLAVAEVPVILTESSLQAALVTTATTGGDVLPLFRFWDVLYNSAAYVLEAGWVGAFGLAMRDAANFPRWLPRLSLLVAALQLVNMSAIWVGIPDAFTLVGNIFFAIFFVGASIGLSRLAATPARVAAIQPV
jgi:hypothetical protein